MIDTLLADLLDIKNFKKLHHSIIVRNLTSMTMIGRDGPINIVEFLPSGLVLNISAKSCAMGHMVSILFMNDKIFDKLVSLPDVGNIKGAFEVLGKVKNIDNSHNSQVITIEFTQYDIIKWEKFFYLYQLRQKQINTMTSHKDMNL